MNMDQLIYFLAAVETGSVNATAQKFFITPQAMNSSLKKLEQELESPLLSRDSKGVALTPQGQLFYMYAQNIVSQYKEAVYELERFQAQKIALSGMLSIFSASVLADSFIVNVIRDFTAIYPNTMIKIIEVNNDELLSYVANGYCELALLSSNKNYIEKMRQKRNDIKYLLLMEDQIVVCARKDHPLMRYTTLNSDILTAYAKEAPFQFSLYQILPFANPEISYTYSVSNSSNADLHKKLMMEEVAVSHMPYLAYQNKFQKDGFAAVPLKGTPVIGHYLIWREDKENSNYQLLQYFLEFLQKKIKKQFPNGKNYFDI